MRAARLRELLGEGADIRAFDSLPSTNTLALQLAREGAPQGTVVLADSQSGGKGRRGRAFYSPPGGLYLSLVVDSAGRVPGALTTLAACAAVKAAEAVCGRALQIKWVNDLLLDGKKAGGILCEGAVVEGRLAKTVIGIGLNTGPADFPGELAGIAATLFESGKPVDREALAAAIVRNILHGLPELPAHLPFYRERCVTLGRKVSFLHEGQPQSGTALDVDEDGALIVGTDQKDIRLLSGDVSLLN